MRKHFGIKKSPPLLASLSVLLSITCGFLLPVSVPFSHAYGHLFLQVDVIFEFSLFFLRYSFPFFFRFYELTELLPISLSFYLSNFSLSLSAAVEVVSFGTAIPKNQKPTIKSTIVKIIISS